MAKMDAFSASFIEALKRYIEYSESGRVVSITDFEDYTVYGGYCETCAYEETNCKITYVDANGATREYSYYGSFAELIGDLTR
jgi:hypothetical protein